MTGHIYLEQRFNPEQTITLERIASRSQQVLDFLSDEEFNLLRSRVLDPDLVYPEIGKVSKYWGFGTIYDPAKDINPWLLPKLRNLIGDFEVDFYAYQEAINPWKIHADIRWYENKVPHKVFLIPLDVEPETGLVPVEEWPETNTITFHQRNFMRKFPSRDGESKKGNANQDAWSSSWNDPCVEGLQDGYHISSKEWQKHFSHMPYEHARGLTLDGVHRWIPRSIMFWDNTALHCSDDFLGHGIRTKRCFMIFTYL